MLIFQQLCHLNRDEKMHQKYDLLKWNVVSLRAVALPLGML